MQVESIRLSMEMNSSTLFSLPGGGVVKFPEFCLDYKACFQKLCHTYQSIHSIEDWAQLERLEIYGAAKLWIEHCTHNCEDW